MKTLLHILALLTVTVAAGRADIDIVLDNPAQTGLPGSNLQFFGTITNTGTDTVYLNADGINFTGGPAFSITDQFLNTPPQLVGGETWVDIELFDVALADPFTDPPGLNGGSYILIGGTDVGLQDIFGVASFSVTVATPEPEYCGILMLAIVGLLCARWRRLGVITQ
jgi:hypothetical protein